MIKKAAVCAIAIATIGLVGAGQIATSGIAKAQYNDEREGDEGGSRYSRGKTPPMPAPGYEGFDGIDNYCTFRREPYRKCFNNRYGEQQCRTVGWRMIQDCY